MTPLSILTAVFNTCWETAALAGLVWVALRLVRVNAATRCAIWWAVLAILLVLPVAPRFAVPRHVPQVTSARAQIAPASYSLPPGVDEAPAMMTVQETSAARWPLAIFALWAIVFLYRLARIGQSYLHLRGVKRNAVASDVELPDVGRSARLLVSRDIASPMAVGFLQAAVILPEDLTERITREELDQILLHEAAHLARRDDWSNLFARLLGAVLALHPVAWWILRRIEYEREAACDDWVVARTGAAQPYAETLARMVELRWQGSDSRQTEALASGVFGRGSRIGDRIEMLLQRGREFSPRVSFRRVAGGVIALCCLAAAGSFAPRWIAFAAPAAARAMAPLVQKQSEPQPLLVAQASTSIPEKTVRTRTAPAPAFDAASVKLADSTAFIPGVSGRMKGGPGTSDPGRITYTQVGLFDVLTKAWGVQGDQISGPAWLTETPRSPSYTITATMPPDTTKRQFQLMFQKLLIERFQMKLHHEIRNIPGYDLVVAPGGPKLTESDPNIPPPDTGTPTGADKDGFSLLPPGHGAGVVMSNGVHGKFQSYTMGEFATSYLRFFVHDALGADQGPIIDKTRLTGKYDFTIKFDAPNAPQPVVSPAIRAAMEAAGRSSAGSALDPGSGLSDLFKALEQQLGLRLVKVKAIPWDVMVIDHVEKVPLEN